MQGQSFDALTGLCAPELSPATAYRIALEFSGGKPWAVSIRGGSVVAADSEEHALALIRKLKEKVSPSASVFPDPGRVHYSVGKRLGVCSGAVPEPEDGK